MRNTIRIGLVALLGLVALAWAHEQPETPQQDRWRQRVGLLHELRALQGEPGV